MKNMPKTVLPILALLASLLSASGALAQMRIEMPGRLVMGLALEPGALWVTNALLGDSDHMRISKLDPLNGNVLQEADFNFNGRGICVGLGSLWVVDARFDDIHRIDPVTLAEISAFNTPGTEPCGVTCDGTSLWVSDPWRQRIDRLTTAGVQIGGFAIPNLYHTGLEWDDHTGCGVWAVTGDRELTLYSPTGTVLDTRSVMLEPGDDAVFDLAMDAGRWFVSAGSFVIETADPAVPVYRTIAFTGRQVMGLDWEPGALWVTHSALDNSDQVTIAKLDPANGTVINQAEKDYNGRGICYGAGYLWVTDALNDVVHQLDPDTFAEVNTFSAPGSEPCGITFDGVHLWLTDPWHQSIYKLSTTGSVIDDFPIPDIKRMGLEWDGRDGTLWTPTDSDIVSRYTTAGDIDHVAVLTNLVGAEWAIDLAIAPGHWFVSCREKIYDLSDPASAVLASFPDASAGFATIQNAVDAAADGDIVSLCSGTFTGAGNTNVSVANKSIRIGSAAQDAEACRLDAGGASRLFVYGNAGGSLEDVTLTGGGGAHFGGAMYLGHSSPAISRCIFTNNLTTGGGSDLALEYGSSPSVTGCVFKFCSRDSEEGPIWMRFDCEPRFAFCQIYGNISHLGDNVLVDINCSATLQNCTITRNSFSGRNNIGVVHVRENGKIYINNCIITLNSGQAVYANNPATDLAFVTASCIFHNYDDGGHGDWVGPIAGQFGVNGNISAYPMFCDEANHVYTLESCSSCAPDNSGGYGQIGALPVGCDCPSSVDNVPNAVAKLDLYPNPFNPSTTIAFELPQDGAVDLAIYDVRGRMVTRLMSAALTRGRHEITWDGTDGQGRRQSSGTYVCRLHMEGVDRAVRMSLIK